MNATHPKIAALVAAAALVTLATMSTARPLNAEAGLRTFALKQEIATILAHSPQLRSPSERSAFLSYAEDMLRTASQPMPRWRYWMVASLIARRLDDPHTVVGPAILTPFTAWEEGAERQAFPTLHLPRFPNASLRVLPIEFYWASDGLVAVPLPGTPTTVHRGDQVVRVGRLGVMAMQARLDALISGNPYWVRWNAAQDLTFGYFLYWIGVVSPEGTVMMTLRRPDGALYTVRLRLRDERVLSLAASYNRARAAFLDTYVAPPGMAFTQAPFAWMVAPSGKYAVFWLRLCWNSPAYQAAVQAFFNEVARRRVPAVILDLQENPGGDSSVVNPWLEHLPDRTVSVYGSTLQVPAAEPLYRGKTYVLTGPSTFSSAMMTADILYVAGEATLVGEATGESPSGPGEIVAVDTSGARLFGQVSTEVFRATGPQAQNAALMPAVPVPLTVRDIQASVNPVARWLRSLR